MVDLVEDARADVASRKLDSGYPRDTVLAAYADVFSTASGEIVLQDILAAYHDRSNLELEEAVATVDHPFRAYLVEGQRSVALSIRDTARYAREKVITGEADDVQA